jgi:hypothetical protein
MKFFLTFTMVAALTSFLSFSTLQAQTSSPGNTGATNGAGVGSNNTGSNASGNTGTTGSQYNGTDQPGNTGTTPYGSGQTSNATNTSGYNTSPNGNSGHSGWGWLGLLGLIGLVGMRHHDNVRHEDVRRPPNV